MSFIAKFKVDDMEMNVLHCGFEFSKDIGATGKPTSIPKGGIVLLKLESNGATNLFDWMINPLQIKSGIITFYRRDTMSKLKTVDFKDAYCINYYETFDHTGDNPMQLELTLSARELKINDSTFKNNWPV